MKRTMILPMIVVSKLWLVAAVAAADSFPITSPQQTDRSVMLAWETHQQVRTVRNSCQWNPSTPTGRTHDAAIVPGEGRGGSAAARIQGNRSEGNARGCFVQGSEDEHSAGRYEYQLFYRCAEQEDGKARLVIDCYIGPSRQYHGLVSRDLPAADDWSPVFGTFELPEGVQLLRCLVYQVGEGTSWYDDVRIASETSQANLLGDSGFDGVESWRVLCRKKGEADWQPSDAVVLERFHNLIPISPSGFNQYAKGVQMGDRLALVWKYGEPYPSRLYGRYMFHDIGLALIDPKTGAVEKTSLVDDVKYNSSPDITWHNGCLVYVYNKFEHLYGGRNDPGRLYGCFIGRLRPTVD